MQPHAEGRLEMAALSAAAHVGKGARTILADDAFQFGRDFINGLIPGDSLKSYPRPSSKDISDGRHCAGDRRCSCPCGRNSPRFFRWTCLLYLDDAVVFHLDFEPAVLGAENTTGFICFSHYGSFLRP